MSKTTIPEKIKNQLLVKSAGRCQFRGCNASLYKDLLTKRDFNTSYIAHIVADVPTGPRGDVIKSPLLAKALENLMLVCDSCHRRIDENNGINFSVDELIKMKKEHEERIETVTAIAPNMQSHILTYRTNIGEHTPEVSYDSVKSYLQPEYYPALNNAIDLSLSNSIQRDKDAIFWNTEVDNLVAQFNKKLLQSFTKSEIKHLSIFAFAPIPLLIKLGTLINDIYSAEIYQPVRNPKTWKLNDDTTEIKYTVIEPSVKQKNVALNISLSASITADRITDVIGDETSIYTVTIENPFNDYLKSKKHLQDFSIEIRKLFNKIKATYDANTPIHIFPAMPIAKAIELGRVWMPKADMPLYIYDQNTANGGFSKVMEILNN